MDLRARIIAAATDQFRSQGLRFTMQEVAEAMHISKKTIYTVYPSKEVLLLDMVDALFARIHCRKQELMEENSPIDDQIQAVMIALPEEYAALDFRQLCVLDDKYPAVARRVRKHLETGWEPTIALLKEGMAQGRIRRVSIPVLRQMVTASIENFLTETQAEDSYRETLSQMIDIIMNGIRREQP